MTFDKTKAMRNAEKYLSQGKIRSAIGEYEQVVKFDAKDFGTINMLGDLYSKDADVRKAVKCYAAVADHYGKQGFAQKAIAVYNKISRLEPNSVEVWKKLAELYKQKGSVGEARAKYQRVAEHYEKAGDKIEALAMWKEIAQLDPTDTVSYLSLADSYLAEKQFDDALDAYTECGIRLSKKGVHEEALAVFEKALSIKRDVPALLGHVVNSLSALGRSKESAEKLSEILAEFPHSREIRILLIDCLIEAGEIAEAEKTVVRLVEMEPANYPKFLELANIYLERDDVASTTRILSMSAEHMLVGGQAEQFSTLVTSILQKDPDQLDALRLQARYCSWQRDEEALCSSLAKLTQVAREAGSVEDERYALLQLTMLVPHDTGYADRLREINAEYGFEGTETEENLFDKRFLKGGPAHSNAGGVVVANAGPATGLEGAADGEPGSGFEFIGHVAELEGESGEDRSYATTSDLARFQKEIDSVRFYIENGYLELAEKAANELRGEFGDRAEIAELWDDLRSLNALVSADDPGAASAAANGKAAAGDQPGAFNPHDLTIEFGFDESGSDDGSDYETHYNTGIAYQEMGLVEDAIKEFQAGAALVRTNDGTRRFFACANLLGHCFMQQGMPQLAKKWYERSLETADLTKEEKQGVWYELAAAHEADGDLEHAGRYFEQVYAENVDFRDVSERIRSFAVNH
ncbi:MAG: tetratricopeptide repeat protein [Acidobacteria bacterium]|nr:tetratricopeptide repeat protein [Acidobacteriota bacterium]